MVRVCWVAALLSFSAPAWAWPVDLSVDVEAGAERFQRLSALDWAEVEDPSVATLEWLPESNEALLSGVKPGSTLVVLYAEGRFAVWRLRVQVPGQKPASAVPSTAAAAKACPTLSESQDSGERSLAVTIKDEPCRLALRQLLQQDGLFSKQLEVTFELPALQAQLVDLQQGVKAAAPGAETRYVGAGLVLSGQATPQQHRRVLWELFRRTVGRVPLEDRLELTEP